jgi:hypothetical protein
MPKFIHTKLGAGSNNTKISINVNAIENFYPDSLGNNKFSESKTVIVMRNGTSNHEPRVYTIVEPYQLVKDLVDEADQLVS